MNERAEINGTEKKESNTGRGGNQWNQEAGSLIKFWDSLLVWFLRRKLHHNKPLTRRRKKRHKLLLEMKEDLYHFIHLKG
jgi:hypothetical protein